MDIVMKRFAVIIILVGALFAMPSCKTKPNCEYNHTGFIEVTNSDDATAEVRLDGEKLFDLEPGQTKEATVASGNRTIRCFSGAAEPEELEEVVIITDCETTTFEIVY